MTDLRAWQALWEAKKNFADRKKPCGKTGPQTSHSNGSDPERARTTRTKDQSGPSVSFNRRLVGVGARWLASHPAQHAYAFAHLPVSVKKKKRALFGEMPVAVRIYRLFVVGFAGTGSDPARATFGATVRLAALEQWRWSVCCLRWIPGSRVTDLENALFMDPMTFPERQQAAVVASRYLT